MSRQIPLPAAVAKIFEAVAELEARYPGRRFTPDGHLVGSIGEVIAAEELGLTLYPASHPDHDAHDGTRNIQIKMVGVRGKSIAMYGPSDRLVVLKIVSPAEAKIVYDGSGSLAWDAAGPIGKNGQRVIRIKKLCQLSGT